MIFPELRDIQSPDLVPPALPADPADCAVRFQALIGPRGEGPSEAFSFLVVTPGYLRRAGPLWGRGHLMMDSFDWRTVVEAIALLMAQCARPTWEEVATELDKQLRWELDVHRTFETEQG
ncbi:MAG TPA: Imm8 family immunity protein [Gemmatimonadales bacterium]|nr:Imm8 family immunity protein [Gemmatimonadales bacterium]